MTQPTRFILLSTQRSGSTWVIDMLNSHPQVAAYSELLLEDGRGTPVWGGARDIPFLETYAARCREDEPGLDRKTVLFRFLDELYRPREGLAAVGFKLMYGQAGAYPELHEYLKNGVRVAHLIRRNVLDVIISRETAHARDVYHVREGNSISPVRISLNPADLLKRLDNHELAVQKARQSFLNSGLAYHEVCYEDLVENPDCFAELLSFLCVEPGGKRLSSTLQRINTTSHEELIENILAIREVLAGTRYQSLLR